MFSRTKSCNSQVARFVWGWFVCFGDTTKWFCWCIYLIHPLNRFVLFCVICFCFFWMILWLLLLSFSCRDSLSLVGVAIRCVKMVCVFIWFTFWAANMMQPNAFVRASIRFIHLLTFCCFVRFLIFFWMILWLFLSLLFSCRDSWFIVRGWFVCAFVHFLDYEHYVTGSFARASIWFIYFRCCLVVIMGCLSLLVWSQTTWHKHPEELDRDTGVLI